MAPRQRRFEPTTLLGKEVKCPATLFGIAWARQQHGKEYKSVMYEGHVESFVPKGTEGLKGVSKTDVWCVKFPGDDPPYVLKWDGLRKYLLDDALRSGRPFESSDVQVRTKFLSSAFWCRLQSLLGFPGNFHPHSLFLSLSLPLSLSRSLQVINMSSLLMTAS